MYAQNVGVLSKYLTDVDLTNVQITEVDFSENLNLNRLTKVSNRVSSAKRTRALFSAAAPVIDPNTDTLWSVGAGYRILTDTAAGTQVCINSVWHDSLQQSASAFRLTPEASYYNNTPVQLNSFGGWIYLESQNPIIGSCQLTRRHDTLRVFDVAITADRRLSVGGSVTQWSSTNITTIEQIPQNEWIYISAYQSGKSFQIGWKRADLTGDTQVGSIYPSFALDLTPNIYNFPMEACMQKASHLFWQPGVAMFDNMWQSDLSTMEIQGTIGTDYDLYDGILVPQLTELLLGNPSSMTYNDVDVYFGTAEGVIVDLRNRTCSAFDAPPLN